MEIVLLAPGPSMSQALADSMRGEFVGAVGNCWELAPWAKFMAANDRHWWMKYPEARLFKGRKFSANNVKGVERLPQAQSSWNSGVLLLAAAVHLGATSIRLYGFDMHGTHYFGEYKNGLRNTRPERRRVHFQQYAQWQRQNPAIKVVNCTPGSALKCFPMESSHEVPAARNVA